MRILFLLGFRFKIQSQHLEIPRILGMPIYATFGSPLFLMLPNNVPNGYIVIRGVI
jgi:hypothetical protein